MAKTLDFNALKRQYMTVILPNDNKTTLRVGVPSKAAMDHLASIQDKLSDGTATEELAKEELYNVCAELMSYNLLNIVVTADDLKSCIDFDDLVFFVRALTEFIRGLTSEKN